MTFWLSPAGARAAIYIILGGFAGPLTAQDFQYESERCLLAPWKDSALSSAGRERVSERLVTRGDVVRSGDVLLRFFAGGLAAQKERASAEAQLARLKLDRLERLSSVATPAELDEARIELLLRKADIRELALEAERFELRAPHDGVIIETPVDVGEVVEDGAAIRLVQISRLRAEFDLPLSYLGAFLPGQTIELANEIGQTRVARVVFVDPLIDIASRSFRLHAEVDNVEREWAAGALCRLVGLLGDQ
jgi:RND family efflux transporter MFP subunit